MADALDWHLVRVQLVVVVVSCNASEAPTGSSICYKHSRLFPKQVPASLLASISLATDAGAVSDPTEQRLGIHGSASKRNHAEKRRPYCNATGRS